MNKKYFKDTLMFCTFLMWIPLGIAAFFLSPVRVDIKLLIAAGASFIAMFAWFVKEGG